MGAIKGNKAESVILTVDDLMAAGERAEREWQRTHRIGEVQFDPRKRWITVHRTYPPIGLDELQTVDEVFHWLCHLSCKTWFTPQVMHDFVMVLRKVTRINEYCRPRS